MQYAGATGLPPWHRRRADPVSCGAVPWYAPGRLPPAAFIYRLPLTAYGSLRDYDVGGNALYRGEVGVGGLKMVGGGGSENGNCKRCVCSPQIDAG